MHPVVIPTGFFSSITQGDACGIIVQGRYLLQATHRSGGTSFSMEDNNRGNLHAGNSLPMHYDIILVLAEIFYTI
jgi:hypothetical protein